MPTLLAFDTASERMTIALGAGGRSWSHAGTGGAKASAALLPAILALLREAGLALVDLDAIAFGRGPGAFTGLRTACSVAQGLAFGAGKPVVALDNLRLVAESARGSVAAEARIWAVIDARMNQIYAAEYRFADGHWSTVTAPLLTDCDALVGRWRVARPTTIAGDALRVYASRLETFDAALLPDAAVEAGALLRLSEAAWHAGEGVDAAMALPLYVRDKVAATTAEREAAATAAMAQR